MTSPCLPSPCLLVFPTAPSLNSGIEAILRETFRKASILMHDTLTVSDPYRTIIDSLSGKRRVLVTTHVRPDGDALGTSVALILGMRQRGIDAELLLLSRLPRKYAFVVHDNRVVFHDAEKGWPAALADLSRFDAFVVCDTG